MRRTKSSSKRLGRGRSFRAGTSRGSKFRASSRRLAAEALEPRRLLAVDLEALLSSDESASTGQEVRHWVQITNLGDEVATQARVRFFADANLEGVEWFRNGGPFDQPFPLDNTVDIQPGQTIRYSLTSRVVGAIGDTSQISVEVTTGGGQVDVDPLNNVAEHQLSIQRQLDVRVSSSNWSTTVVPHRTIYPNFQVKNQGIDTAKDVSFEAPLDAYDGQSPWTQRYVLDAAFRDGETSLRIAGSDNGQRVGDTVRGIGDINGDSLDDIAVVAPSVDVDGRNDVGQVLVVFGSTDHSVEQLTPSELHGINGFRVDGSVDLFAVGRFVDGLGDVNGDGIDDFLVSATTATESFHAVVFGSDATDGFDASLDLMALDGTNGFRIVETLPDSFWSASAAGDVNGDGFADIVVADLRHVASNGDRVGAVHVVFGKSSFPAEVTEDDLSGTAGVTIEGIHTDSRFSVLSGDVGDLNGDGFDDLAVADHDLDEVYVIFGRADFHSGVNLAALDGGNGFTVRGVRPERLASAGDLNDDGIDDLLISGSERISLYRRREYESLVVYGSTEAMPPTIGASDLDGAIGFRVVDGIASPGGDINGDGRDDLIVGDDNYYISGRSHTAGRAFVLFATDAGFPAKTEAETYRDAFWIDGGGSYDLGGSVDSIGDFNGDGNQDFIVGAIGGYQLYSGTSGIGLVVYGGPQWSSGYGAGSIEETHDLAPGVAAHYTVDATIAAALGEVSYDVTASIPPIDQRDSPANNTATITHNVIERRVDLEISIDQNLQVLTPGGSYRRVVTATNTGQYEAIENQIAIAASSEIEDVTWTREVVDATDSGVFRLSEWTRTEREIYVDGISDQMQFGYDVDVAGDLNGDGYEDLAVSARNANVSGSQPKSGAVYVLFGGPRGIDEYAWPFTLNGENGFAIAGTVEDGNFGVALTPLGDVNGDGLDDLLVGDYSPEEYYVIYGRESGFPASLFAGELDGTDGFKITTTTERAFATLANTLGDINNDGLDDFVLGSWRGDEAFVVYGRAGGFGASLDVDSLVGQNGFHVTNLNLDRGDVLSAAGVGDVNNDGVDDFAFGTPRRERLESESGSVITIFGRDSFPPVLDVEALEAGEAFRFFGTGINSRTGQSVAAAGDLNHDGIDDLVIGAMSATWQDPERHGFGEGYVVFGSATGFPTQMHVEDLNGENGFRVLGPGPFGLSGFGRSVAGVGDFNGDGIDDMMFGQDRSPNGAIVYGRNGSFPAIVDPTSFDGREGFILEMESGVPSIARKGDYNGDGLGDMAIGYWAHDVYDDANAGRLRIVYGRNTIETTTGTGAINQTLSLAPGQIVVYTIEGTVRSDAIGSAATTAIVLASDGNTETDLADNIDSVHDTIIAAPELESIAINGGDASRSNVDHIEVVFDVEVDHGPLQTAFTVQNLSTGEQVGVVDVHAVDLEGKTTAVLTFAGTSTQSADPLVFGSLADGNYRLKIDAQKVRHHTIALDGDGDGVSGGDHVFGDDAADLFFRYFGDSDGDQDVDGLDLVAFSRTFLRTHLHPAFDPAHDIDADGDVDGVDYTQFARRFRRPI